MKNPSPINLDWENRRQEEDMYTPEQLARRDASPLTRAMMIIGGVQIILLFMSYYYELRFLLTGQGWVGALITFWINFVLLWVNTIIGIIWEKQFYNQYFMCPEFFWEDVGNLAAILAYAFFFTGLWLNWSQNGLAVSMLIANTVYGINVVQWVFKRMIFRPRQK
jgi:3-vinyl bacteriochlorophyllide hydratase